MEKLTVGVRESAERLGIARIRGPPIVVGLLIFKTCVSREIGTAEFDSQTLPPEPSEPLQERLSTHRPRGLSDFETPGTALVFL